MLTTRQHYRASGSATRQSASVRVSRPIAPPLLPEGCPETLLSLNDHHCSAVDARHAGERLGGARRAWSRARSPLGAPEQQRSGSAQNGLVNAGPVGGRSVLGRMVLWMPSAISSGDQRCCCVAPRQRAVGASSRSLQRGRRNWIGSSRLSWEGGVRSRPRGLSVVMTVCHLTGTVMGTRSCFCRILQSPPV